ncbi:MAG: 2-octaprenyl-6-methoxyphenyl hydroxylase, partial [Gammaproteobacteria bacterium]|nr:2-octaprenyl-6-methoxyphenyl hydroxylase [Gammaproteobacteria bacterium]
LHPVAGQGFNLGLRDVAALADVIADADDPGGSTGLRSYRQWRQSDHERVIRFTDGLVRLFTSELPPLQFARSAGLQLLDILGPPRAMLARQSMGISGRLPRLSRGVPLR